MKRKRLMAMLLAAVMTAGTMAGCAAGSGGSGSGGSDSAGTDAAKDDAADSGAAEDTEDKASAKEDAKGGVTLTVMANAMHLEKAYIKKAFELYEEKTGNTLELQGIPSDNFEQVSQTKFNTGDIPDIFLSFGNNTLAAYNPEENFVDFTDAEWVSDLEEVSYAQAEYRGKVWGLPFWEASATGFLYNKDIFEKYNLSIPTTQDEFMDVCAKLKEEGITPFYLAFKDAWPILEQVGMDVMFSQEDILTKINTNKTTYSDMPEMTAMVQWYKDMADNGYLGENYTTNTWDYAAEALGTDKYAMMLGWDVWLYTVLNVSYEGKADKFGLMPAFTGTNEEGTIEGPNNALMLANKNSKNVEAATEFVNFMADPENYNAAFDGVTTAPVFKGQNTIVVTPQYKEAEENGILEKVRRASSTWGNVIGFSQAEPAKCIQEVMLGTSTIEEALANMDADRISTAKAQQAEGF
jgi:raffinose/stachyose/melibiose transport system substrate-binding protein